MVVDTLYEEETPRNRAELPFDLSAASAAALESLYKHHSKPADFIPSELFRQITATLNHAISEDFRTEYPDLVQMIENNNEVFSAFKVHDECSRMAKLLTDSDGKLKSFEKWVQEAEPISNHHNKVWLRTEYDTAIRRAAQAREWKQFEDEADVLPNLRWVPSTAVHPNADHMAFWDTIRPIDDPFWAAHKPGDRWGCKCSLEATDEPATQVPEGLFKDEPAPGLDNNPAKDGALFSKSHPYFPKNCNACPFNPDKTSGTPTNKAMNCEECKYMKMCLPKSESSKERFHYLKEMEILKDITVVKETDNGHIMNIGFTSKGNKHLYSDTLGRTRVVTKEDLHKLDQYLKASKYINSSALTHPRSDRIDRFHYYKVKIHNKWVRLNVAERVNIHDNMQKIKEYFLYSINDIKKIDTLSGG